MNKNISFKTRKILVSALVLFVMTLVLYLWLVAKYQLSSDAVLAVFFLYGAIYAGWFWLCTQIAYKLKHLNFGILLFLGGIVVAFGVFWLSIAM